MWIRSQNKEELVECSAFYVQKNIGGKKKSVIMGFKSNVLLGRKDIILGFYDTKELALNELTKLQTELVNNTKVYEMI